MTPMLPQFTIKDALVMGSLLIVVFITGLFRINHFRMRGMFSMRNILVEVTIWIIVTVWVAGCLHH